MAQSFILGALGEVGCESRGTRINAFVVIQIKVSNHKNKNNFLVFILLLSGEMQQTG
jgi:hypothetical protein